MVDFAIAQSLLSVDAFQTGVFFGVPVVSGAFAGMCVNFALSRRYVFDRDDRHAMHQMRSFFFISVSTMMLRLIVGYALVGLFALPFFAFLSALPVEAPGSRLAQVGAMGLVTFYSFLAHKHISFAGGIRLWLSKRLSVR